ncbi:MULTISPECIES: hypothetical protein [unclassified Streptomyces]|uniref:hypothetical protein n=1 Tax=unclassified Streptomyces TaxID=2593676 RepID=UPI00224DA988|nr:MULTISPECIES: hypothetical protein [unclassified Streptomyces]MCX4527224.1 hypothetical protein [Streptomyces sp. NBC_01551]MCX4542199.1 hypothetical protein [Streptomyces sp. NBC_01565]
MTTLYLLLALLATAAWTTATVSTRMKALQRRADRLERRLGLVLDHFGIAEPEPAGLEEVRTLAREGRTVEAIRVYRKVTGADLLEAKQAVEAL